MVACQYQQVRNAGTLKEISIRLKSISNIEKITKSMKMIASTKVNKAQRAMETARAYGEAADHFFELTELNKTEKKVEAPFIIVCSSDKGLCGGINSYVSKAAKKAIHEHPDGKLFVIGQKARSQLNREYGNSIAITFDTVAKNIPTFSEAAAITDKILKSGLQFNGGFIIYNYFKSVIAFETKRTPIFTLEDISSNSKLDQYEHDSESLSNFAEFSLSNKLFWSMAEGFASEMAARRTAMENATKNAGEMIQKLTLTYNRSRQAAITNELIDIITGASAM